MSGGSDDDGGAACSTCGHLRHLQQSNASCCSCARVPSPPPTPPTASATARRKVVSVWGRSNIMFGGDSYPQQQQQQQQQQAQVSVFPNGDVDDAVREMVNKVRDGCCQQECILVDPDFFDQTGESIFHSALRPEGGNWFVFPPLREICAADVMQGELPTCWLMSVMAVLAEQHPSLIRSIFVCADPSKEAVIGMKIIQDGLWVAVLVDLLFPTTTVTTTTTAHSPTKFKYAFCGDRCSLWVPLLEKAYAKTHGGYQKISVGHLRDAFFDLTGMPVVSIENHVDADGNVVGNVDLQDVVPVIESYLAAGCTVAASCQTPYAASIGLNRHHAYSVLQTDAEDQLIAVRNPWGTVDNPDCFSTIGLPAGAFWLPARDFLHSFTTIAACATLNYNSHFTFQRVEICGGEFVPRQALAFEVFENAEVYAVASQPDERIHGDRGGYFDLMLVFMRIDEANGTLTLVHDQDAHCHRTTTVCQMLTAGRYLLVPFSVQCDAPLNISVMSVKKGVAPLTCNLPCPPHVLAQAVVWQTLQTKDGWAGEYANVDIFSKMVGKASFIAIKNPSSDVSVRLRVDLSHVGMCVRSCGPTECDLTAAIPPNSVQIYCISAKHRTKGASTFVLNYTAQLEGKILGVVHRPPSVPSVFEPFSSIHPLSVSL